MEGVEVGRFSQQWGFIRVQFLQNLKLRKYLAEAVVLDRQQVSVTCMRLMLIAI
jgi:hypothetical protein